MSMFSDLRSVKQEKKDREREIESTSVFAIVSLIVSVREII